MNIVLTVVLVWVVMGVALFSPMWSMANRAMGVNQKPRFVNVVKATLIWPVLFPVLVWDNIQKSRGK